VNVHVEPGRLRCEGLGQDFSLGEGHPAVIVLRAF
jgi:hypothetical protein